MFVDRIHVVDRTPNRFNNAYSGFHKIILEDESRWFLCGCGAKIDAIKKYTGKRYKTSRFSVREERQGSKNIFRNVQFALY